MAKKRTTQLLADLKKLASQAGENLYLRIELAAAVMLDLDWIATAHGGSDLKAMDALQDEYFRDLGGFISIGKLIAMHEKVPQSEWESVRYDVAAVEVLYDAATKQETETREVGKRTAWKALAEERAERIKQLEAQVKELMATNAELREKAAEATARANRLEGRLEALESISDRRLARV